MTSMRPTPDAYDQCAEWKADLHVIYAEEPPPKRAVDAVAYNATLAARKEKPGDDMLVITWQQQLLQHFIPYANAPFPRRGEVVKTKPTAT